MTNLVQFKQVTDQDPVGAILDWYTTLIKQDLPSNAMLYSREDELKRCYEEPDNLYKKANFIYSRVREKHTINIEDSDYSDLASFRFHEEGRIGPDFKAVAYPASAKPTAAVTFYKEASRGLDIYRVLKGEAPTYQDMISRPEFSALPPSKQHDLRHAYENLPEKASEAAREILRLKTLCEKAGLDLHQVAIRIALELQRYNYYSKEERHPEYIGLFKAVEGKSFSAELHQLSLKR